MSKLIIKDRRTGRSVNARSVASGVRTLFGHRADFGPFNTVGEGVYLSTVVGPFNKAANARPVWGEVVINVEEVPDGTV